MRGAKDEDKVIRPMFPRLHVNDTEKGGPKGPPRNKMALYEQLSIPSQKFNSGSASVSVLPLPPNDGSSLVPSTSSSHGCGYEKSVFTQFCNPPAPSHLAKKHFSHSSGGSGVKLRTVMASEDWEPMNASNDQTLSRTLPLSSSAKCNSFLSHNFSKIKSFSKKKLGDDNDSGVPSSAQLGPDLHSSNSQHSKDREKPPLSMSFSMQFQNDPEKQKKETGLIDLKTCEHMRNQTEENETLSQALQNPMGRSASVPSVKDRTSADASSSPLAKVECTEQLKHAHSSGDQEYRSSSLHVLNSRCGTNARLNEEFVAIQNRTVLEDNIMEESGQPIVKENASKVTSEPSSRLLLRDNSKSLNKLENGNECHEGNKCGLLQVPDVERHYEFSEMSMVDSIFALDITPDDVVRVIGEKQFWRARKALVNQQKVFAAQVFELHKLIKVQKLIAGSPHILLEGNIFVGKTSLKICPAKKLPSEFVVESLPPGTEFADDSAVGKLPHPSVNNEINEGLHKHRSNCGSHSGNGLLAPISGNARQSPPCFPPPGNQWLVPVMSPSEGLVYKPYVGPCLPAAGFMAPVCGGCGPMSSTPGGGDSANATYGVRTSHQGIEILPATSPSWQTYFPPYGMPVINPCISSSAVEPVSPFTGSQSKDNQLSVGDINFVFPHQGSCNMSSKTSRIISCDGGKIQASKKTVVEGSTGSSPCGKVKGDILHLFPMEPLVQASDQNAQSSKQPARVIKVVPHNRRSATQSAARIFHCIQEERKQTI